MTLIRNILVSSGEVFGATVPTVLDVGFMFVVNVGTALGVPRLDSGNTPAE
tara:strand:- start:458 stop:610 length:153 start_codon:yes stop_codon:yes gene_type:complete